MMRRNIEGNMRKRAVSRWIAVLLAESIPMIWPLSISGILK
jgi:hypothetical protein